MSLKTQPMFDGVTPFGNKSFHLVSGPKSPKMLERQLAYDYTRGPMLGTTMKKNVYNYRSYGKTKRLFGRRSFGCGCGGGAITPLMSFGKRYRKSRKKSVRTGKKRRSFGKFTPLTNTIGLPEGAKTPKTIYDTFPNIYEQGAPLKRPYGPRDNLGMKMSGIVVDVPTRRRSFGKYKKRSFGYKKYKRSFGTTPGTKKWVTEARIRNNANAPYARYANSGVLKAAKGSFRPEIMLLDRPNSKLRTNMPPMLNQPMQFSNNQMNSPGLRKFGTKFRRGFGKIPKLNYGPNTVAYQKPIPMYYGGSTTINFANNKLYSPKGLIPPVSKVQPNGTTPGAWLTQSKGFQFGQRPKLSQNFNIKKLTSKNMKISNDPMFGYGKMVYNPMGWSGSGHNTVKQPEPPTLTIKEGEVSIN